MKNNSELLRGEKEKADKKVAELEQKLAKMEAEK